MSDITKRAAIIAIFGAALAKMAHADEPPKAAFSSTSGTAATIQNQPPPAVPSGASFIANPNVFIGQTYVVADWNKPMPWSVNLDQMSELRVYLGKDLVTITAAEIFAALKSP